MTFSVDVLFTILNLIFSTYYTRADGGGELVTTTTSLSSYPERAGELVWRPHPQSTSHP